MQQRILCKVGTWVRVLPVRFWNKVSIDQETGCWMWGGSKCGLPEHLYGQIRIGGASNRRTTAHRFAYLHVRGPIPKGLEPDHLCNRKLCVNPWHLELVTHSENHYRRFWRGKDRPNIESLLALHRQGLSLSQIAKQTGIRYLNVWRAINGRTKGGPA